jgi:chemotaxis signal transduction protein
MQITLRNLIKEENQFLKGVWKKRGQVLINMLKNLKIFRNIEHSHQHFLINNKKS